MCYPVFFPRITIRRRGLAILPIVLLVAFASKTATAAPLASHSSTGIASGEFIMSTWYGEGGLPHNVINDVVRDTRGFLWIGTRGGVARFDGRFFTQYPVPPEFAQGRYDIRAVAVEDERTVVLITGANKLVRLRDGIFTLHPADKFLSAIIALDLAFDDTGALWIGTGAPTAGTPVLMRWDGENMETFGRDAGIARRSARFCVATDSAKRVWIAGGDFFGWYENGALHSQGTPLASDSRSYMMTKSRSGALWIASRESLARFENNTWTTILSGDDWPAPYAGIQDLYETSDGVLWLATRRDGLFRLIDGRLKRVRLPHDRVESINEDNDGNVWLGINGGGLVRLKPKRHVLLNTTTGLPTDVSSSITEDETGAMWFANQVGGTVRVKTGRTIVIPTAGGDNIYASNICADQQGTVWVGALSGLYSTRTNVPDESLVLRKFDAGMPTVQTLFSAANRDLWVGWSNSKLGRIRDGKLREFNAKDGIPPNRVAAVVERQNPAGPEIWVAMQQGLLFKLSGDGERFDKQPLPPGSLPSQIYAMHVDANNRLWIGTSVGLLLWDEKSPRLFTCADGFPDDVIYQINSSNHNRIWLGTRVGIFSVQIEQLLAIGNTPGRRVTVTLFGQDDNLDGLSGMVGGQPMSWKSRDGRIWFATYRGVVGFDATNLAEEKPKLPVYIDGLSVNGAAVDIHDSRADGEKTRITPNPRQIEFSFTALNYSAPERTHVRRMLEGFDVDWVDASGERGCVYSRLPPGDYTFRVEAMDPANSAQRATASIAITVAAAWWQTSIFWILVLAVFTLAVAWCARHVSNRILRQRLRRLEQEKALDRERSRIARDLHDELGSRMSRIGFTADTICKDPDANHQKTLLAGLVDQTRDLVEDLHRVVWTVNPRNDSWQRLAEYISRYAQRLLAGTRILCTIDGVTDIPDTPVTPEVRHHIVAITKEALNNMLKHAKADAVKIKMDAARGNFSLSITDNGCGFDETALGEHEGYGLQNMRERMSEAGGSIDIRSRPREGTQIKLDVSLEYRPPRAS